MPDDNLPAPRQQSNALAIPAEWAELANFDDGSQTYRDHFGLAIPRLRSDFGRNGKGWIDDLSGEIVGKELTIVILAYPPSRAWWELSLDEGGGGGRPDCFSHDMLAPSQASTKRQAELCGACPHSRWGPDGERPRCSESVNVLAIDIKDERFFWLRFAGTALKPFQQYVSYLASKHRLPSFAAATHVVLKEETKGKYEFLVPQFEMVEQMEPAAVKPWREVARQAMASWQQIAEEMAEAEAGPFDTTATEKPRTVYAEGEQPF